MASAGPARALCRHGRGEVAGNELTAGPGPRALPTPLTGPSQAPVHPTLQREEVTPGPQDPGQPWGLSAHLAP